MKNAFQLILRQHQPAEDETIAPHRAIDSEEWQHLMDVSIRKEFYFFDFATNKAHDFTISSHGRNKIAMVRKNLIDDIEEVLIADLVQRLSSC